MNADVYGQDSHQISVLKVGKKEERAYGGDYVRTTLTQHLCILHASRHQIYVIMTHTR